MSPFDLSALQHCTIGGEAMNPMVYQTFRDLTGLELKEGYGQTEAAVGEHGEICLRLPDGARPLGGRESVVSCEPRGCRTSCRQARPVGAPPT